MPKTGGVVMAIGATGMIAADALRGWYQNTKKIRDFPLKLDFSPWHWSGALITFKTPEKAAGAWFSGAAMPGEASVVPGTSFVKKCRAAGLSVCELDTALSTDRTVCVAASFEQLLDQAELGKRTNQIQKRVKHGVDKYSLAVVTRKNLHLFKGFENPATFFAPAERLEMFRGILTDLGIDQMLETGDVQDLTLLHDSQAVAELMETWVHAGWNPPGSSRWARWVNQPIDQIKDVFGQEIAFYFAFLGHYTRWLLVPAVVGLLIVALQCAYPGHTWITTLMSVFVVCWAQCFIESLKNMLARQTFKWGGADALYGNETLSAVRADFQGEMQPCPITGELKPQYPAFKRRCKQAVTLLIAVLSLAVVGCTMFFFLWLYDEWADSGFLQSQLPTVGYCVSVKTLSFLYRMLANWCVSWENHRTYTDHENALILKLVVFELFNNNCSLFYIAFFRQDMKLLQDYLLSLLVTFQVVFQLLEVLVPSYLNQFALESKLKQVHEKYGTAGTLSKEEVALGKDHYSTFDDYLEMIVQFGHVTLFAAAFPLSPLCALANNCVEMRMDAFKLISHSKRPIPGSATGIGAWEWALQGIAVVAVFTNVGTVVFTSSQLDDLLPDISLSTRLILFLALEQILLLAVWLVEVLIPDVPQDVTNGILRQAWKKEQLLLQEELEKEQAAELQAAEQQQAPVAEQAPVVAVAAVTPIAALPQASTGLRMRHTPVSNRDSQTSDSLMSPKPKWVADSDASNCQKCTASFGLFTRRHHCRGCGRVFCGRCCHEKLALPSLGYTDNQLVCVDCFQRHSNF